MIGKHRALVFLVFLLVPLSGCAGSIFNTAPMLDTRKDAQDNTIVLDTPRMWADWTTSADTAVASEAAGGPPGPGLPDWQAHWHYVIKNNTQSRENPSKYLAYVIEARRRAGLPELSGETCNLIRAIHAFPFRREERGIDPLYDALMHPAVASREIAGCIADTRPMPDPRQSPNRVDAFVTGDAAYMLLTRKLDIAFESLLPPAVSAQMPAKGANVYFEWIAQPGNREALAASAASRTD
jgi:hypothetical protein